MLDGPLASADTPHVIETHHLPLHAEQHGSSVQSHSEGKQRHASQKGCEQSWTAEVLLAWIFLFDHRIENDRIALENLKGSRQHCCLRSVIESGRITWRARSPLCLCSCPGTTLEGCGRRWLWLWTGPTSGKTLARQDGIRWFHLMQNALPYFISSSNNLWLYIVTELSKNEKRLLLTSLG